MKIRRFIRKRLGGFHRGQRGVTLIELLIVVVILGIIAGIVIPSVGAFKTSGTLSAANSEVANVKTAATAYLAENDEWPATSADVIPYLDKGPKGEYTFNTTTGNISDAAPGGWGDSIAWDAANQKWIKAS
ncbi:MAG: prepilin-type N-terminal cleavage/methylation domain-containing protein [Chloroflexi bacterium]|nr:prepilin-type N-terminal cleavage/methylation domain-containing protein [Chloroflexota bacterium]